MTGPIRVLDLAGSSAEMGTIHGSAHAAEIGDYTADRVALSAEGTAFGREQLLELAGRCLPVHRRYSESLSEEMDAMAAAAGITSEEALIVGGYTDFIDLVRAAAGSGRVDDTCTAVIVPDDRAAGAGFLAQTWDMHASATPHVVMLDIRPEHAPGALVFSTVGCLGQIGMNEAGIAIGINNLTAADGRVGVTWPFVVRKVLEQSDFQAAVSCVLDAPLAGGHNFLVFDSRGNGVSIEAMPTATHVETLGVDPLIHTNHCLAPGTAVVEGPRPPVLDASSRVRLAQAAELLDVPDIGVAELMALTRDERSICRHPEPPYSYESCGAAIMRPRTGEFWACWGVPSDNEYERFDVVRQGAG
ncbi:MAG TPA: C45 family peptidase [Acidimicrobiia bacterium]|nr:C45 family peptidase [Acidimicrobiia bacterium]